MGQAKRKRDAWGSNVVHPMVYLPARTLWSVVVRKDGDGRSERFARNEIRRAVRIHRSIASIFDPDRTPLEAPVPEFEDRDSPSDVRFDENGEAVLFYDEDLRLVREPFDAGGIRALVGQPGRFAVPTGEPVEVAIDAKNGGFVSRTGRIAVLEFFGDKMILAGPGAAFFFRDPLCLQMVAIMRDKFSSELAGSAQANVDGFIKHMGVFDLSTDACLPTMPGVEVERVVFRGMCRYPQMLLDDSVVGTASDLMPRALDLYRDAYGSLMSQLRKDGEIPSDPGPDDLGPSEGGMDVRSRS